MPRGYTSTNDIKDKRGRRRNTTWTKVKRWLKKRGLSIK